MPKNSALLDYKPAELRVGKEWIIVYYVRHPETGKMHRQRKKMNDVPGTEKERLKYCTDQVKKFNKALENGWNPLHEKDAPRGSVTVLDAMQTFLQQKSKELRPDSMRSYRSHAKQLKIWLTKQQKQSISCAAFTMTVAVEYMNDIYRKKNLSNRTWNNYRLFYVTLWNWMKEQQMVTNNAFAGIRTKKNAPKNRTVIPAADREWIKAHLQIADPDFLMACLMVFHALVRPKELCHLKPENFHLKRQVIHLPGSITKNGSDRYVTIPDALMPHLVSWNFGNSANNKYLFTNSNTPMDGRYLSKKWDKMRAELQLPKSYKLYSLRDSGIIQLLQDGVSPEEVMRQADHHSLEVTSVYVKHANSEAVAAIKNKATAL